jgi:hypothetical protein
MPHDFGLSGENNDGLYEFLPTPPSPGETAEGHLWLLVPERNAHRFFSGFEYKAWAEGEFIAKGVVIEVINEDLRRH